MITLIEKVPTKRKCEEFQPINVLTVCEKIKEKVIKIQQIEQIIEYYGILSGQQSGFRKWNSCETTVNYVIRE